MTSNTKSKRNKGCYKKRPEFKCGRCKHEWVSYIEKGYPKRCPKCKSVHEVILKLPIILDKIIK
jgi:hypothetical protein